MFIIFLSTSVYAQTTDNYTLSFYSIGGTIPVQIYEFNGSTLTCNLAPLTSYSTINPDKFFIDDINNAGRVCRHTPAPGSPLFSLPFGDYVARIKLTTPAGTSAESNDSNPFERRALPNAPTGLVIAR